MSDHPPQLPLVPKLPSADADDLQNIYIYICYSRWPACQPPRSPHTARAFRQAGPQFLSNVLAGRYMSCTLVVFFAPLQNTEASRCGTFEKTVNSHCACYRHRAVTTLPRVGDRHRCWRAHTLCQLNRARQPTKQETKHWRSSQRTTNKGPLKPAQTL